MPHIVVVFFAILHAAISDPCRSITSVGLRFLQNEFSGQIVTKDDQDYANATQLNSKIFKRAPCLVLYCQSTRDVQVASQFARHLNLNISLRSGGHNYMGWSLLDDTIALDFQHMNSITIHRAPINAANVIPGSEPFAEPSQWEAHVGPGARSDVVVKTLSLEHGLQTSTGGCPTVALGGFLLGGGHPIIARSTGAGVDNVIGMEVVLANGSAVNVSAMQHADLYWGLRGSCGLSLGIVTMFRLRTYSECGGHGSCFGGHIVFDVAHAGQVAALFADYAPRADPRLGLEFFVESAAQSPSTGGGATVTGVFNGPASEAKAALAPFLTMPDVTILENTWVETKTYYDAWYRGIGGPRDPYYASRRELIKSAFMHTPMTPQVWASLAEEWLKLGVNGSVGMNAMGGSWSAPDVNATAYPHRKFLFNAIINPIWYDESRDSEIISWFRDAYLKYYEPHCSLDGGVCEVYCNYPDKDLSNYPVAYWGPNLERLTLLKQKWDPNDFFKYPQGIPKFALPKHWGTPRFIGKRALVTGGDTGIGLAAVQAFYLECASVMLVGHSPEKTKAAFESVYSLTLPGFCPVNQDAPRLAWIALDTTNSSAVVEMVNLTVRTFGGLDIAVHSAGNAGDGSTNKPLYTDDDFMQNLGSRYDPINVNVYGTLRCMSAELRYFVESGVAGSIVNVGSICGDSAAPWCWGPLYISSKAAMNGFTKHAANTYARRGIRVNVVEPGWVNTSRLRNTWNETEWQKQLKVFEKSAPMGRIAEPWELAGPITFLSSDMASYVTGAILTVDGGLTGGSPVKSIDSSSDMLTQQEIESRFQAELESFV